MLQYVAGANFQTGALASAYTAGGTSLALTSGHGSRFPSSGDFWVRCENEIFKATARSTDTLTVTGGQDGTANANHAAGAEVYWVLGVAALDQLRADIGGGGGSGGGISSLTVAAFKSATTNGAAQGGLDAVRLRDGLYECIWNGSAWDYYHGSIRCERPLLSGFSNVTSGYGSDNAATVADNLHINITGTANNQGCARGQALTVSAPYRVEAGILQATGPEDYGGLFVELQHVASGKGIYHACFHSGDHRLTFDHSTGGSFANSVSSAELRRILGSRSILFVGIEFDGTTLTPVASADGIDWLRTGNGAALSSHVINAPTQANFRQFATSNYRPYCKIVHWKQKQL